MINASARCQVSTYHEGPIPVTVVSKVPQPNPRTGRSSPTVPTYQDESSRDQHWVQHPGQGGVGTNGDSNQSLEQGGGRKEGRLFLAHPHCCCINRTPVMTASILRDPTGNDCIAYHGPA